MYTYKILCSIQMIVRERKNILKHVMEAFIYLKSLCLCPQSFWKPHHCSLVQVVHFIAIYLIFIYILVVCSLSVCFQYIDYSCDVHVGVEVDKCQMMIILVMWYIFSKLLLAFIQIFMLSSMFFLSILSTCFVSLYPNARI